jgi:hypothetical protein
MDFTIDAIECNRRKQNHDSNAAGVSRSYNTNFHTPIQQNTSSASSSGYQPRAVTNPYSKSSSNVTSNKCGTNTEIRNDDSTANVALPYASDMMMQGLGTTYVTDRETSSSQHPHRGGRVRNQRQFGTSIGVSSSFVGPSAGGMMTDDLRRCMTAFTPGFTQPLNTSNTDNDGSDNSSTSSDDDALLSFDIFQKK